MKGGTEEVKEINPMFPRLHVKDAEKGGPKAPPRNKMALYEQFSIPSQSFASGSASTFPHLLRNNCPVPSISGHVGSSQSIQFCSSSVSSYLAEKIHNSRRVNLTKLTLDGFINCNNSLKKLDGGDAFITPDSACGGNSCCSISQNNENEDKHVHCKSNCSLKSQNSFRNKVNSTRFINLKSAQYGTNQIEENSEVSQIGQKPEEGSARPLAHFGDMTDESSISSVKVRTPKSMKKAHASLQDEIISISVYSLKTLQGSNGQTRGEDVVIGDKINLRDNNLEKLAVSDVHKCSDGLEIGRKCLWGKKDRHRSEDMYRHYDALNKPISNSIIGMDITPDDVLGVIGEKQFWKARRTIINQQRVFLVQVFELHRLIKVQRLIAGSPNLLLEDNLQLNKPSIKVSAPKKLQSDYVIEGPSSNAKLNSKSEKPTTAESSENTALGKIPLPGVNNNMSKGHSDQLSNYGNLSGNPQLSHPATNTKQSPYCIYPAPGNQWLVPFMSPSEGLVYKPYVGPCPPNAGFMAPVYSACSPMSLIPRSKDVSDATDVPTSHQGIGILSGTPLPQFFPPCGPPIMHPSAFALEQMSPPTKVQSSGTENHQSAGEVNSAILYRSSSNISSQMSQVMSRHVTNNHPFEDKELQTSTASSPSKRTKGDTLPLFPVAPTFCASTDQKAQVVEHQPRIIKALPHNPKSATESAARIFRSIQEERKHL